MASLWVKICGVRDVATALGVAELGPQAIGLNFYAPSARSVSVDVAAEIVRQLPAGVEPVGLFVNASQEFIEEHCRRCGLRTIQLHGDEPPSLLRDLASYRIIRAFRIGEDGVEPMADYLRECAALGALPAACLVDAKVAGAFGGTGRQAPWSLLRDAPRDGWPPLILAGGLTPENVAEGIRTVRPWGVDVAGGVESAEACKDLGLVRKFIQNARQFRPA